MAIRWEAHRWPEVRLSWAIPYVGLLGALVELVAAALGGTGTIREGSKMVPYRPGLFRGETLFIDLLFLFISSFFFF